MRAAKEVTQCYMITGDADFVLIVAVEDVEAFDVFVKTKLYTNPNARKFKSMIALDRVKFEPRVLALLWQIFSGEGSAALGTTDWGRLRERGDDGLPNGG
ncbi:Lrp/AsnC ligand binding domain-containing protein [Mesorhizobium loti]|nr:Lrp/AsnC ligand binding domain-containing protein [Mesorhizobium loti]